MAIFVDDPYGMFIEKNHDTYRDIMHGKNVDTADFRRLLWFYSMISGSVEGGGQCLKRNLMSDCERNNLSFTIAWRKVLQLAKRSDREIEQTRKESIMYE